MPNWCMNRISISSDNKKDLENLFTLLEKWTEKEFTQADFGKMWLGNVVGNSGIADPTSENSPRCRGEIDDMEFNGDEIKLYTSTAWSPMLQMWRMICDKYLPDAQIIYESEEPGCGLYCTNDPDIVGKYIFDNPEYVGEIESDWEMSETVLKYTLRKLLNITDDTYDIDKLIQILDESDIAQENYISVHLWEYAEINDWE